MNEKLTELANRELLHGGDYNPEQWLDEPDILKEDIRLMKKARVNVVTLGVFSWSVLEPGEGEYHLDWLAEIMDNLYENGIYTILATPSGAKPVWIDEKYPEALRVNEQGHRYHHGVRHNHCMSSERYRQKVKEIDTRLANRFGKHPGLLLWHISNELGGVCYCENCQRKFQKYLEEKFHGNIDELNKAWWTTFWSHRYQRFDQIEPPLANGETSIMGLNLEWKRFTTWNMTDYMKSEIAILRELTPDIPVTTNFMKLYPGLDYRVMCRELDVISWDSYPRYHNDYESIYETCMENAFDHAVMRGMSKGRPFLLMESVPGAVNWHDFNKLKRPGMHRLAALQAIACGCDSVQYFQWRKSRGSFEQYHGAVVDHLGRADTRIFRETAETGELLTKLKPVAKSLIRAQAAIIFDWDNRWAIQDMKGLSQQKKRYEAVCMELYRQLSELGVETDIIGRDDDLSGYKAVFAPMLYLLGEETADRLKSYVKEGGQLMCTYLTGYVDSNTLCYLGGFPGDGLTELFGLYAEEIDSLYPTDRNQIRFIDGFSGEFIGGFSEGYPDQCSDSEEEKIRVGEVRDFAEILKIQDAQILAVYCADYYEGEAAVTRKAVGTGMAWYVGARLDADAMKGILREICREANIENVQLPPGVEYHCRESAGHKYHFYLNYGTKAVAVTGCRGTDLITGKAATEEMVLEPMGAVVMEEGEWH